VAFLEVTNRGFQGNSEQTKNSLVTTDGVVAKEFFKSIGE
jgi:hypothetical protein